MIGVDRTYEQVHQLNRATPRPVASSAAKEPVDLSARPKRGNAFQAEASQRISAGQRRSPRLAPHRHRGTTVPHLAGGLACSDARRNGSASRCVQRCAVLARTQACRRSAARGLPRRRSSRVCVAGCECGAREARPLRNRAPRLVEVGTRFLAAVRIKRRMAAPTPPTTS